MSARAVSASLSLAVGLALAAPALAASEIKGKAILDHPCGKTALKHMGLVNAGKMAEAMKLGSPEMIAKWEALPADERGMVSEMMQALSKTEAEFAGEIEAHGVLTVDGKSAKLVVEKKTTDASGTSTETHTQDFAFDGKTCLIAP
jgi:hypothetical protein